MSDARSIALALGGRWFGSYGLTYCPAHPNTLTPALSLANGKDGRLLATCHSGCDFLCQSCPPCGTAGWWKGAAAMHPRTRQRRCDARHQTGCWPQKGPGRLSGCGTRPNR
jgi:hypothetical protein